jgi:transposase-like protein
LRQGSYYPAFLEPCRIAEKALATVIQEACVDGVSTRSVADIERGFRALKSEIDIAPVYHRLPQRIRAHAMVSVHGIRHQDGPGGGRRRS